MTDVLATASADVAYVLDDVAEAPSSRATYHSLKRAADVIICVAAAPAAILLLCLAAAMIVLTMGRPIFFAQDRVGLNGRTFRMLKLRTMRPQASGATRLTATTLNDPRITPFGACLRRTHVDELPQLWNVLRGEMTLIGPRPEQPLLVQSYRTALAEYDRRHLVKPGLSGWAQVRYGYAADLDETSVKLRYDLHYVDNCSLWLDLKIAALTVLVFMNKRYVR